MFKQASLFLCALISVGANALTNKYCNLATTLQSYAQTYDCNSMNNAQAFHLGFKTEMLVKSPDFPKLVDAVCLVNSDPTICHSHSILSFPSAATSLVNDMLLPNANARGACPIANGTRGRTLWFINDFLTKAHCK